MIIEMMLAFGNNFAASFNIIYLFEELDMPIWSGPIYLGLGFGISVLVSLWMSWKPHLDPRNALIVSLCFLIGEYTLFFFVRDGWILSFAVGLAFGMYYPLFWTPFNILMAQMTKKGDRGVTYGAFFFVWPLATFAAPFLGALVIDFASYQMMFAIGIAIIIATALVVFAYRAYIPKDQVMRIRLDAIGKRNVIALLGEGGFEGVFWADFVIIAWWFVKDEVQLGILFSLFGLSAGIMAIILGKVSDKIQNRRFFVQVSALTTIPFVVLISLASSLEEYAIANGLLEFCCFMFPVFLFAIITDKLEDAKNDSVIGREYLLDIGRVITIAILMVLLYLEVKPQVCLLISIPFLLMIALAHEPKREATVLPVGVGHTDQLH
jgi:predicted MFS family arabinose efflux permease